MKYQDILPATFMKRINRFIAHVMVEGTEQRVHVKNTGRLKELLLPGADVLLERSVNPARKTPFSLIGVRKGGEWVNIDSLAPNQVVFEALAAGAIGEIGRVEGIKKEVTYGNSRFDLSFESRGKKGLIEVKGVTLESEGVAMFPDAPTARGTRHIYEMIEAVEKGYVGVLFFLIQMKGVSYFTPNRRMDAAFTEALRLAAEKGVRIFAYDSVVCPDEIVLGEPVKIRL